ncbi:DUF624 domain-containing protein [Bacillus tamaricis]|uniref:DUF624 domain-containing protein n=1 Tax=Evansella tamaricis TaxID=2069301 RepID=A0ABS6JH02_9BACI|nr:DUF624 domain-containing protein [Evansella tamaricis]MBU9712886.1 DUF624 domain-containing protein [Evansella tamaricis]
MGKIIIQIAEVIYKFVALNILWLIFFLVGLGIFGFMPSTVALFSIVRDWLRGDLDTSLFSRYLKYYKGEFVRSNILGVLFMILFYIIYVNFSFVSYYYDESIQIYIYIIIAGFGTILLMTFVNLFSVIAHFEYKIFQYIKVAAGLVFLKPINTLFQLIWLVAYFIIAINHPTIFVVIGVSVFAFVLMSINYSTFKKLGAV